MRSPSPASTWRFWPTFALNIGNYFAFDVRAAEELFSDSSKRCGKRRSRRDGIENEMVGWGGVCFRNCSLDMLIQNLKIKKDFGLKVLHKIKLRVQIVKEDPDRKNLSVGPFGFLFVPLVYETLSVGALGLFSPWFTFQMPFWMRDDERCWPSAMHHWRLEIRNEADIMIGFECSLT